MSDATRGAESADGVREVTIDGRRHWTGEEEADVPAKLRSAHLLPNYDEYFVGYKDRSAMLQLVKDATPEERTSELFAHVIALDGQLVGGWIRTVNTRGVTIDASYLAKVSAARRREVAAQAARYGAFFGMPVELVSAST